MKDIFYKDKLLWFYYIMFVLTHAWMPSLLMTVISCCVSAVLWQWSLFIPVKVSPGLCMLASKLLIEVEAFVSSLDRSITSLEIPYKLSVVGFMHYTKLWFV